MTDQRRCWLLRSAAVLLPIALVLNLFLAFCARAQPAERQTFGKWTVACQVDKMTDAKNCFVISQTLDFAFSNGRLMGVIIGLRHYPGSYVMLRIDSEPALSAKAPGFRGREADEILERFTKNPQRILIRYQEYPDRTYVDREVSIEGFSEALAYVRSASGVEAPAPKAPQ
jgi:invasion protein IalB